MKTLKWIISIGLLPLALVGAYYRHQGQQLAASGQLRIWGLGEWNDNTEIYLWGDVLAVVRMKFDWHDPTMPSLGKTIRSYIEPINPKMKHARGFLPGNGTRGSTSVNTTFNRFGLFVSYFERSQQGMTGGSPPPGARYHSSIVEVNTRYAYLFALPFLVLVTLSAVRRYRRPPHDRCRVCGYDLRASPERCPECGTERIQIGNTKAI
jgi:hypothetical protein